MEDKNKLADRLNALSPEQRAILLQRFKQKGTQRERPSVIPRQSRDEQFLPLSPAQERLWFMYQLDPQSSLYNLPVALHVRGKLNEALLEQSLNALVGRHESLRVTFANVNGRPQQVIAPELRLPQPVINLQPLPEGERRAKAAELMQEEAARPFNLAEGPLIRAKLLRLDDEEHIFLITKHHIVSDGWSFGILHQELWALYDAGVSETAANLPDLPIQYVDFAVWQRDQLQEMDASLDYWRERLAAPRPILELPADRPRPAVQTFNGGRQTAQLPPALYEAVKALSKAEGVTLFMLLLAAFKALLFRYTGERDLLVASPVAGRERAELSGIIGFFVNTLVLRTDLSGAPSFRRFLHQVQETALAAYEHQEVPFARLVEVIQPERDMSHTPLFQVMFVLQDNAMKGYEPQALTIEQLDTFPGTSRFDLTLEISELNGRLQTAIDYNSDLFEAATVQRMLKHFQRLLESVVADPEQSVMALELLTEAETAQLMEWNRTERPFSADLPIHRQFERLVEKTPDKPALTVVKKVDRIYEALNQSAFNPTLFNTQTGTYMPVPTAHNGSSPRADTAVPLEEQASLADCCFKANPFHHRFQPHFLQPTTTLTQPVAAELTLLTTHTHIIVAVSNNLLALLDDFDGRHPLKAIAARFKKPVEYTMGLVTVDTATNKFRVEPEQFRVDGRFESWLPLIKALHMSSLIELVDYKPVTADTGAAAVIDVVKRVENGHSPAILEEAALVVHPAKAATPPSEALSPVLILGATTGVATVGVMYLASFLRRHGIEAYCQLNDIHTDKDSLRRNVRQMLERIQPKIVGVSMKWFPHMARGLEICQLVKEYSPDTKVVLGGDTATYFAHDLINYETVDYIVLGDGEIPLLRICQQAEQIPNCLFKRDGQVVASPISYLHQEESLGEVYLSHLDEIFVSPADLALTPYLFIFTGRGCPMNCQYCGGAREVQVGAFKRPRPYSALRGVREARNDMIKLKPYTSTFLFDFDTPNFDSLSMYKALWEGIDLKSHFGYFYFWYIPNAEFIELVANTFKYVSLNIDLNSLSERHRKLLSRKRFGKPQPSDAEIFHFFETCEKYENVETAINLINGLPYFEEEDIGRSEQMLEKIMQNYPSFVGLGWGRLHAQPGAPLLNHYEDFDMRPSAATFADFLHHSELNNKEKQYPDLGSLHYPIIYYQDDRLNSQVTKHYVDCMRRLRKHLEQKQQKLRYSRETLTYGELNEKANQLARWLRKNGLHRMEERVGICLERSSEMVVAALAVLKAGGAYVPLDPAYPQERLSFMTADAQVSLLITDRKLAAIFADKAEGRVPVVCIDSVWELVAQESGENLSLPVSSDNLAYVLYTSGSTGKPKGVMIQHQGVCNLAQAQGEAFGVYSSERVLQFAPFSFDASVSELFVTLLNGAALTMASQELLMPGPELIGLLQREEPNVMTCPPSVLAALPADALPQLHTVVSAGEACSADIVRNWGTSRRFINAYGPTEGTVCATLTLCEPSERPPTIGRAIDNTQVYLLDEGLQRVPVGVPGEIFIGGVGLARGYFNRAGLTAERFVPNPFGAEPGARLYRTGDLARLLPDGRLDFLGRSDNQVKIRGSRVETGEVEAALAGHPDVRHCAVAAWDIFSEKRLVAYVTFGKNAPTVNELRAFLKTKLPDYMIPYSFMVLEALPLLPNGKIDRRALPEPDRTRPELTDSFVAPRDNVEELVAEIWADCLEIERVGVFDNFFELGGHSLLITRVIAQLGSVFQVDLPARVFLETPTIAGVTVALGKYEAAPGQVQAIARLNKRLNQMSADELRVMLREKKQARRVTFNGF